jgi:CheY-like chemotaxis protein
MIEDMGIICHYADNGADAIDIVTQHPFHLVLMDLQMPGILPHFDPSFSHLPVQ